MWERWQPVEGESVESCTILTTVANALMAPIHDRMPVILPPAAFAAWLGEQPAPIDSLWALLQPYAAEAMAAYPVSRYVNAPDHDDARCIEAAPNP